MYRLKATQTLKATLLLCWTHRVKNSTVVITNWVIDTKISISQRQRIFIFFSLSSVWRLPADLTMSNMTGVLWELSNTTGVLWERRTLREHVCSPYVFGGVRVARLFMFSVLYFLAVCLRSVFCGQYYLYLWIALRFSLTYGSYSSLSFSWNKKNI